MPESTGTNHAPSTTPVAGTERVSALLVGAIFLWLILGLVRGMDHEPKVRPAEPRVERKPEEPQ